MRTASMSALAAILVGAGIGVTAPLVAPAPATAPAIASAPLPAPPAPPAPAVAAAPASASAPVPVPAPPAAPSAPPTPQLALDAHAVDSWLAHGCYTQRPRGWISAEYLLWSVKNGPLPVPLVTTGSPQSSGILGRNGTQVLFGGDSLDFDSFSGVRLGAGMWLADDQRLGIMASGFMLEQRSTIFLADSDGNTVLSRPYINAQDGQNQADRIAFPTAFAGNVDVSASSQLWGAEVNATSNVLCRDTLRVDALAGFRYLTLEEDLMVSQNTTILGNGVTGFQGARIINGQLSLFDSFQARNNFYGGQLGAMAGYRRGNLSLDVTGKLGLGWTHQRLGIDGTTTLLQGGGAATVPGGLLALPSNIGNSSRNEFSLVPEVTVRLGYDLRCNLTAFVGYNFLYWGEVARPGNSIDPVIDRRQLPTSLGFNPAAASARPAATIQSSDFWAQGVNFGLLFKY